VSGVSRSQSRRHHRFRFDAAWRTAVDTIINPTWTFLGRGSLILLVSGEVDVRLPDGRVYRGVLKRHISKGQPWFVGFVSCQDENGARRDERLNAEGALPEPRPPSFDLWPLQVKLNPARKPGKADYLGLMWVSALDGCRGGEVYRLVAGTRRSGVFLNGYVVRYGGPSRSCGQASKGRGVAHGWPTIMGPSLASCLLRGEQIGVAKENPVSAGLLAQDRQRVARPTDRFSARRRHRHREMIAQVRPVACRWCLR
jgi:hypothetical protein